MNLLSEGVASYDVAAGTYLNSNSTLVHGNLLLTSDLELRPRDKQDY